jgi:hypothetical protein
MPSRGSENMSTALQRVETKFVLNGIGSATSIQTSRLHSLMKVGLRLHSYRPTVLDYPCGFVYRQLVMVSKTC